MKKLSMWLLVCMLTACSSVPRNSPQLVVYDFGLPVQRLGEGPGWSNLVLDIRAPYWFDSLSIEYRLLYDDPLKLRSYAGSRWAGAPGLLLAQRLRQQLGLISGSARTAVACLLRLDLHEFSQAFDTPQRSRGVLLGAATVLDAKHRIVAERLLSVERPALSADAGGGVHALVEASDELGRQLAGWLYDLQKADRLHNCPLPAAG